MIHSTPPFIQIWIFKLSLKYLDKPLHFLRFIFKLLIDLNIIGRSVKINETFIDFHFSKEMDHALILVKINNDNKSENVKDKTEQRNYKILLLKSPGRGDIKLF